MNEYDTNLFYYGYQQTNDDFFKLISFLKSSYFLSDNFGINIYVCPYSESDSWNHWFFSILISDDDQIALKINDIFNQVLKNNELLDFKIVAEVDGLPKTLFNKEKFLKCVKFISSDGNDTYYEFDTEGNYTELIHFDGIKNIQEYVMLWHMYSNRYHKK